MKLAAIGARWVNGEVSPSPASRVKVPPSLIPVSSIRSGSMAHRDRISSSVPSICLMSLSGSPKFQVVPVEVGATTMKPRLRASRSHVHRNVRPWPEPPCIAITIGTGVDGSRYSGT